jgi:hypothetical protein
MVGSEYIHAPFFLPSKSKDKLEKEIRAFLASNNYPNLYISSGDEHLMQGDAINGLEKIIFDTVKKQEIRGIAFSNSCDMSVENPRIRPMNVCFSPLIKLSAYLELLESNGIDKTRVSAHGEAIRKQELTNIFFLPSGGINEEDSLVIFDDISSMPLNILASKIEKKDSRVLFSLSQFGHYLLLFKLSIHFCRFSEHIERS